MADTKQHDENLVGAIADADEFYLEQKPGADWLPFRGTYTKLWTWILTKLAGSTGLVQSVTKQEFEDLLYSAFGETLIPGVTYIISDVQTAIPNCPIGLDRINIRATEVGAYDANMSGYIVGSGTPVKLFWDVVSNNILYCENPVLQIKVTATVAGIAWGSNAMENIDFESTKYAESTIQNFKFENFGGDLTAALTNFSRNYFGPQCSLDLDSFTGINLSYIDYANWTEFIAIENGSICSDSGFGWYCSITFGGDAGFFKTIYGLYCGNDCVVDTSDAYISGLHLGSGKSVHPLNSITNKSWFGTLSTIVETIDIDLLSGGGGASNLNWAAVNHAGIVLLDGGTTNQTIDGISALINDTVVRNISANEFKPTDASSLLIPNWIKQSADWVADGGVKMTDSDTFIELKINQNGNVVMHNFGKLD